MPYWFVTQSLFFSGLLSNLIMDQKCFWHADVTTKRIWLFLSNYLSVWVHLDQLLTFMRTTFRARKGALTCSTRWWTSAAGKPRSACCWPACTRWPIFIVIAARQPLAGNTNRPTSPARNTRRRVESPRRALLSPWFSTILPIAVWTLH